MNFEKYIKCQFSRETEKQWVLDPESRCIKLYLKNFEEIFMSNLEENLKKCYDRRGLPYIIDATLVETISAIPTTRDTYNFEVHIDYAGFKEELMEEIWSEDEDT